MIKFKKQYHEHNVLQEVLKWIVDIIVMVCLTVTIIYHFGDQAVVVGHSMEPKLYNGDTILINKLEYTISEPDRYDIIVFDANDEDAIADYYIKRIVGLPGETIMIDGGKIYINGKELTDDVVNYSIYDGGIAKSEIVLGNNEFFVLGDNRNNSEDSRQASMGLVRREAIRGTVWLRIDPVERFGIIK